MKRTAHLFFLLLFSIGFLVLFFRVATVKVQAAPGDPCETAFDCRLYRTGNYCCGSDVCNDEYIPACTFLPPDYTNGTCTYTWGTTLNHIDNCTYGCSRGACLPPPPTITSPPPTITSPPPTITSPPPTITSPPSQCVWGGVTYSPGDNVFQCGYGADSCTADSCVGVPYVCNNDGSWSNANPLGECTTACTDCRSGDPSPTPTTPPPTPTEPPKAIPDQSCWESVSKDGTNWSTNSVTANPGERVYFRMDITETANGTDWFGIRNKFDDIIDGYTNIWQNTNALGGNYPALMFSSSFPGIYYDAHYEDYGGFNTGQRSITDWSDVVNPGAQTFRNMGYSVYTGVAQPAQLGGIYNDRCWQEPESGGPTCIDIADGCNLSWVWCPYTIYFQCNKVTVEVNQPKASIDGSRNILIGQTGSWTGSYTSAQSGQIYITRQDGSSFYCPSGIVGGRWCALNPTGTSTPFSRSWTPQGVTDAGNYYAVINAFSNATGEYTASPATECSGNPFITFPNSAWSDCGPNDSLQFTVSYPPPSGSIAGSKLNATVGEILTFVASANSPTGNLNALEVWRCPTAANCSLGSNWTRMQQYIAVSGSGVCSRSSCAQWLSWDTTGMPVGSYYLAVDAYDRDSRDSWPPPSGDFYTGYANTECSGDPTCSFNGGVRNCSLSWSNCGNSDYLTVTLDVPPPTCTNVTASPFNIYTEGTGLLNDIFTNPSVIPNGTFDHLELTVNPLYSNLVTLVSPQNLSQNPAYTNITAGTTVGTTYLTAHAYLRDSLGRVVYGCSSTPPGLQINVLPPSPWFQTYGGDVHAEGNIRSPIPSTAIPPYFSAPQNNFPGVVSDNGYTEFGQLGPLAVSPKGWLMTNPLAYSYGGKRYDYAYFDNKIGDFELNPKSNPQSWNGSKKITGDLTISQPLEISGGHRPVVLVEGNLIVNEDIKIKQEAEKNFLAIIVQGNITIDPGVTDIQGIFIADKQIKTGNSSNLLTAKGIFVGYEGFNLGRNNQPSGTSGTTPAEKFIYDPNLIMNTPNELNTSSFIWQEIAP